MLSYHEITALTVGGEGPFAFPSINAALEYVRELRRIGVAQPIAIRLTDDTYTLKSTLRIDSGVTGITIEPAGNKRVTILGGVEITGFGWDTYNGAKMPLHSPSGCMQSRRRRRELHRLLRQRRTRILHALSR